MTTTITTGIPPGLSKGFIHDRGPTKVGLFGGATAAAPHSQINRASYTVPTNRKAVVNSFAWYFERATVATVIGGNLMILWDNTTILVEQEVFDTLNAIGDARNGSTTPDLVFLAAQVIAIADQNGDTAGTTTLTEQMNATEFDA